MTRSWELFIFLFYFYVSRFNSGFSLQLIMRYCTSMMLLTISTVLIVLTFISSTDARYVRNKPGFKQARATRGFKGAALQVGRGFGKRASEQNDVFLDLDDALPSEMDGITERYNWSVENVWLLF